MTIKRQWVWSVRYLVFMLVINGLVTLGIVGACRSPSPRSTQMRENPPATEDYWILWGFVPVLALVLLGGLVHAVWLVVSHTRYLKEQSRLRRRTEPGFWDRPKPVPVPPATTGMYCRTCGYDLRGSTASQRCPECGRFFSPWNPLSYAPRPRGWALQQGTLILRRWTKRIVVVLGLLAVVLAAGWGWCFWGWAREQRALATLRVSSYRTTPPAARGLRVGWVLERVTYAQLPSMTTDADLVHLRQLPQLRTLVLSYTRVTDAGLRRLRENELSSLDLSDTLITDAGLEQFKACRGLRQLWLFGTRVTWAGVEDLRAALPRCRIEGP